MTEKIKLSGISELTLQSVYALAKESKGRGAIHDEMAEKIVDELDYDFTLIDTDNTTHDGIISKEIVLDKMTKAWFASRRDAIVVNIACGLDTRCYRVNGYSHWYNIDSPEMIDIRKKLLPETGIISQIGKSVLDDWGKDIVEENIPVLIIIEGLTMYLTEEEVKRIFAIISNRFKEVTVFVETMNPKSVEKNKTKFSWGVKNGNALDKLLPDFSFFTDHKVSQGMMEFASTYRKLDKWRFERKFSNKIIVMKKTL